MDPLSRRQVIQGLGAATAATFVGLPALARSVPVEEPSPFRVVDLGEVSYRDLGRAMGEALRGDIAHVMGAQDRALQACEAAMRGPMWGRIAGFREAVAGTWPHLLEEVEGMAEGANVAADLMFAWNCRSEIHAITQAAGCSTVGLAGPDGFALAHNEDGNAAYFGRMTVIKAVPPSGVAFAYLVYPGNLIGNAPGINSAGICQCTNFISCTEVGTGIPRYFTGRAVAEAASLDEAEQLVSVPGRAFPWHHNIGSVTDRRLLSIETWPPDRHDTLAVDGVHLHTNHLLHDAMQGLPENLTYFDRSTGPRMEALTRLTAEKTPASKQDLLDLLADRSGEPCKVCRQPDDEVPGVTVATAMFTGGTAEMTLIESAPCWGRSMSVGV